MMVKKIYIYQIIVLNYHIEIRPPFASLETSLYSSTRNTPHFSSVHLVHVHCTLYTVSPKKKKKPQKPTVIHFKILLSKKLHFWLNSFIKVLFSTKKCYLFHHQITALIEDGRSRGVLRLVSNLEDTLGRKSVRHRHFRRVHV